MNIGTGISGEKYAYEGTHSQLIKLQTTLIILRPWATIYLLNYPWRYVRNRREYILLAPNTTRIARRYTGTHDLHARPYMAYASREYARRPESGRPCSQYGNSRMWIPQAESRKRSKGSKPPFAWNAGEEEVVCKYRGKRPLNRVR